MKKYYLQQNTRRSLWLSHENQQNPIKASRKLVILLHTASTKDRFSEGLLQQKTASTKDRFNKTPLQHRTASTKTVSTKDYFNKKNASTKDCFNKRLLQQKTASRKHWFNKRPLHQNTATYLQIYNIEIDIICNIQDIRYITHSYHIIKPKNVITRSRIARSQWFRNQNGQNFVPVPFQRSNIYNSKKTYAIVI